MAETWTGRDALKQQLQRYWDRGELLRWQLSGESVFPLRLRIKRPTSKELGADFDRVRRWLIELEKLPGYDIRWQQQRHRLHGSNRLPESIWVKDYASALRLISKQKPADRFRILAAETLTGFPDLKPWLLHYPLKLLDHQADWSQVLQVLTWFQHNPASGRYLRQLDIPGVDTKFIEKHRGLLSGLLDAVLPPQQICTDATGVKGFNRRYGLRDAPSLIRFRLLDPDQHLQGLSDISVPVEQLSTLVLPVANVFITENKVNGLAFPEYRDAMVIFGLGYGLDQLKDVAWLREKNIYYWGDIDTHGFRMLNQLRKAFPHVRSLLMDDATLMRHQSLWVEELPHQRSLIDLTRLTEQEQNTYDDLRYDRLTPSVRLEQERLGFSWVRDNLRKVVGEAIL